MPQKDEPKAEAAEDTAVAAPKKRGWQRWINKKTVGGFIAVSIVVHGVGFLYFGIAGPSERGASSGEVSLGDFEYLAPAGNHEGVLKAGFTLHVALIPEMSGIGRSRLNRRKFKVQQDIEELLRQAAAGDFEDPTLTELKRQLQEKINETLDKRVVAEVIITDLSTQRAETQIAKGSPAKAKTEPTGVQWKEKEPS